MLMMRPTAEDRQHMMETLVRFEEEQAALEGDSDDELALLETLSTKPDLSFSDLTPQQQADFQRALRDGRLSDMIEIWQPWWEEGETGPTALQDFPPLNTITRASPHPSLRQQLITIMYGITCTHVLH